MHSDFCGVSSFLFYMLHSWSSGVVSIESIFLKDWEFLNNATNRRGPAAAVMKGEDMHIFMFFATHQLYVWRIPYSAFFFDARLRNIPPFSRLFYLRRKFPFSPLNKLLNWLGIQLEFILGFVSLLLLVPDVPFLATLVKRNVFPLYISYRRCPSSCCKANCQKCCHLD